MIEYNHREGNTRPHRTKGNKKMKYELSYHINGKGTFDKEFDHYPTDKELQFLIDRNDVECATIWKRSNGEWLRVIDLI